MKNIQFNGKEYQIPEGWSDCTLGHIIEAQRLSDLMPNAPIVAVISAYVGIPINELTASKAKDVQDIMAGLDFISNEYIPKATNVFEFDGHKYGCPDDLIDIRFDQWVSVETVIYNYRQTPVNGLTRMIASLCLRPDETIDDFNLQERAELFENLPFTTARDIESFFLISHRALEVISRLCSTITGLEGQIPQQFNEVLNTMNKHKERSTTSWLMKRRIGIYQKYLQSLQSAWEKSYNSSPTEG